MGDMGDIFNAEKIEYKKRCAASNSKYEPQLLALGAVQKSDAVYELNGWLCYPTKGFAMLKKDNSFRTSLAALIDMETNERQKTNECS